MVTLYQQEVILPITEHCTEFQEQPLERLKERNPKQPHLHFLSRPTSFEMSALKHYLAISISQTGKKLTVPYVDRVG